MRACQLRTHNLPTAAIPSNPPEQRLCRAGCGKSETINHVLQSCPLSHWQRVKRHDDVLRILASFSGKTWPTEREPHVRHSDGTLFKPDLAVHISNDKVLISDVAVCWEGQQTLTASWVTKKRVYDNQKFREAASKRWANKSISILPLIMGARGIWPRYNDQVAEELKITRRTKEAMVNSVLKWGSTIHKSFMASVWHTRGHRSAHRRP